MDEISDFVEKRSELLELQKKIQLQEFEYKKKHDEELHQLQKKILEVELEIKRKMLDDLSNK